MAGRSDGRGGRRRGRSSCRAPAAGCRCGGSPRSLLDALRRLDPPGEDEDRLAELVRGDGDGSLARWYYYLERLSRRGLLCHCCPRRRDAPGHARGGFVLVRGAAGAGRPRPPLRPVPVRLSAPGGERGRPGVAPGPRPGHPQRLPGGGPRRRPGGTGHGGGTGRTGRRASGGRRRRRAHPLLRAGMLARGRAVPRTTTPPCKRGSFTTCCSTPAAARGRSDAPLRRHVPPGRPARPAARPETGPGRASRTSCTAPTWSGWSATTRRWRGSRSGGARSASSTRRDPITDRQLGEFLFRVARVKDCRQAEVATACGPVRMDFASRPYPAGGGLYELELYAAVNRCADLRPGLYHYDPARHRLTRLCGRTAEVGGPAPRRRGVHGDRPRTTSRCSSSWRRASRGWRGSTSRSPTP